jgi:K+-sensing histidine kinase KdpD
MPKKQLRASRRELAQVSRQTTVGAMTASIAHEVNQPLAAIVTNANAGLRWLARAEPDLDEVRSLLKRIVSDGHRASEVIASIRSMFGKDPCEKSPLSVNDLIGEVLALIHGELESHQISLQNEMLDGLPRVMAVRVQLQQVLLNLIMNSMAGYERCRDEIRDYRGGRSARLDVAQLVKHAFALRTAVNKVAKWVGKRPILYYLYAEPERWANRKGTVPPEDRLQHRAEIAAFSEMVADDEVSFLSCSYSELLADWAVSSDPMICAHAHAVARCFSITRCK